MRGNKPIKSKVIGQFIKAAATSAVVTMDKERVSVRPAHERREYTLPLSVVAEMIVCRVVRTEISK